MGLNGTILLKNERSVSGKRSKQTQMTCVLQKIALAVEKILDFYQYFPNYRLKQFKLVANLATVEI